MKLCYIVEEYYERNKLYLLISSAIISTKNIAQFLALTYTGEIKNGMQKLVLADTEEECKHSIQSPPACQTEQLGRMGAVILWIWFDIEKYHLMYISHLIKFTQTFAANWNHQHSVELLN